MAAWFSACSPQDMWEQPRFDPLEPTGFFADSQSARPLVPGTVARGYLHLAEPAAEGAVSPAWLPDTAVAGFPLKLTPELMDRGRERFQIYCAPCHGPYARGDGFITRRGFPAPPSLHEPRLLQAPDAHIYNVITKGIGRMYPYGYRVKPADRWAIIAYIRALQLSLNAPLEAVPPDKRFDLEALR